MTIQEAYAEALRAENEIWHSQEEKFQQRSIAHIVERHFYEEDNPILVIRRLLNTNEKEEKE